MFYKEYMPSPMLQSYVERYWIVDTYASDSYPMEHILTPNGLDGLVLQYRMDVPNTYYKLNQTIQLPANYVLIQPSAHWKLSMYDISGIAGVFFKPGVLQKLLKYPMNVLANQPVELEALIGNIFDDVCKQMADVEPAERINLMERLLCKLLHTGRPYLVSYANITAKLIRQQKGSITIRQLADELHVSRQFLTRQFTNQVGVSPKEYAKIVRFNAVHRYVANSPTVRWTDVTYLFGYTDQSHFIKDFRKYMGMLPTDYPLLTTEMADFYAGTLP